MSDVMIVAKFNASAFFSLSEAEKGEARTQAVALFGSGTGDPIASPPAQDVNWIYSATPVSGEGGWVAIVPGGLSYNRFSAYLTGPLSKIYDLEIYYLNRTETTNGGASTTLDTMVPIDSHSW